MKPFVAFCAAEIAWSLQEMKLVGIFHVRIFFRKQKGAAVLFPFSAHCYRQFDRCGWWKGVIIFFQSVMRWNSPFEARVTLCNCLFITHCDSILSWFAFVTIFMRISFFIDNYCLPNKPGWILTFQRKKKLFKVENQIKVQINPKKIKRSPWLSVIVFY